MEDKEYMKNLIEQIINFYTSMKHINNEQSKNKTDIIQKIDTIKAIIQTKQDQLQKDLNNVQELDLGLDQIT